MPGVSREPRALRLIDDENATVFVDRSSGYAVDETLVDIEAGETMLDLFTVIPPHDALYGVSASLAPWRSLKFGRSSSSKSRQ